MELLARLAPIGDFPNVITDMLGLLGEAAPGVAVAPAPPGSMGETPAS